MKQKRGWLWVTSGILLAVLAGLLTFQLVNELTISAKLTEDNEVPTVTAVVAVQKIPAFSLIEEGTVVLKNIPANLVPEDYAASLEDVVGKLTTELIAPGEMVLNYHLLEPTDPDSPVIYRMESDQVLVAIPASSLLGQIGMLSVGAHIDLAYTGEFDFNSQVNAAARENVQTTFLSLQNLEVKGLIKQATPDERKGILTPRAILLAVSPQEALIIKYLVDAGGPLDLFLRAPGNQAFVPVAPVDEEFLIDYFQLDSVGGATAYRNYRTTVSQSEQTNNDSANEQKDKASQ